MIQCKKPERPNGNIAELNIDDELSNQITSDPANLEALKSHCEGVTTNQDLHEFKISDKAGRVVYTSNDILRKREAPAVFIVYLPI